MSLEAQEQLDAQFLRARERFWKKAYRAWDSFDERLEQIRLEQQSQEKQGEDDSKERWVAERVDYVSYATGQRVRYNSEVDAAFSRLESQLYKMEDEMDEIFKEYLFQEQFLKLERKQDAIKSG